MAKKPKLATPAWITEGYDSPAEYAMQKNKSSTSSKQSDDFSTKAHGEVKKNKSGKIFKIRECPSCGSDEVNVKLVGEEGKNANDWVCKKCGWIGSDIVKKELTEDEMMKYLDDKGEEV